ncbi:MAG: glycosyltransferase family 9 protein [Rhodanobacteraceae bacterium]
MRNRFALGACNAHIQESSRRLAPRLMHGVFNASRAREGILQRVGIRRILICRNLHRLGDSITLTPLLEELAADFPRAEVDIISGYPAARALYGSHANVRSIVLLPAHVASHPLQTLRVLHSLRRRRYDLAIDPDLRSQSSRLLTLYAHADRKLGFFGPKKSGALSHGVDISGAPCHRRMTAVYLARKALGEDPGRRAYPLPNLRLSGAERERGGQMLALIAGIDNSSVPPRCIGLYTNGTRDRQMGCDWWQRFLGALQPSASACRLVEILPPTGRSLLQDRYPSFCCPDARELAAMLANLFLYVGADCGVTHLAWAAGVPTVGLFKVTNAAEWGPWGGRNRSIDVRDTTPERVTVDIARGLDSAPVGIDAKSIT